MIIKSICLILIILTIRKIFQSPPRNPLITIKDIFSNKKTIIESHRGTNREIFENTLESFTKAINYGVDSIETDVWLSKDNVLVIFHGYGENGQMSGMYDHGGNITETKWTELSGYRTIYSSLKMPTLQDVIKLTKNKIFLNLEIKDSRVDLLWPNLIQLIEKYNYQDQIAISSFYYEYYNKTKEYNLLNNKNIPFGFLYHKNDSNPFILDKKGNSINVYYTNATKELCKTAHKNGMAVLVWFDMIDEENFDIYRQLINNRVNVICSNEPALAKKFVEEYYRKYYRVKKSGKRKYNKTKYRKKKHKNENKNNTSSIVNFI